MQKRINTNQRIHLQNVAEREIMRYADDHALWHKHVHNVELDPMQILKCVEMDAHDNTVDYSCRRAGKTALKELWLLKYLATHRDQELGIAAPREAQSIVNLNYHLDAIRRSEILSAFLDYQNGRKQISNTYYQLTNKSRARAYGIMANVDGGDLTCASLEEVDDMPADRLFSRFLLMMGSTRRLGASKRSTNRPQVRITGVFKGADTLSGLIDSGDYHVLPVIDAHLAISMGIWQKEYLALMRSQLSPYEYIRQLMCQKVSAQNLIWEKYLRFAMTNALKVGIELVQPVFGEKYRKQGLVSFGYDHSGHGENIESSRYALVVLEQWGNYTRLLFCYQWSPGTDESTVIDDLLGFWAYFMPDAAIGDAYGIGLLTQLNKLLFERGLTHVDHRALGESTQSVWPEWAFAPLRFEGMQKHNMCTALASAFNNQRMLIPYLEDHVLDDPNTNALRLLIRQLPNIEPVATTKTYASYKMQDKSCGDDLFDAMIAGYWALALRGMRVETIILVGAPSDQVLLPKGAGQSEKDRLATMKVGSYADRRNALTYLHSKP